MVTWGSYYDGECVHGREPRACVTCTPSGARDTADTWVMLVAIGLACGFVLGHAIAIP